MFELGVHQGSRGQEKESVHLLGSAQYFRSNVREIDLRTCWRDRWMGVA